MNEIPVADMDDAQWIKHLGTISDPVEMLRIIIENEMYFVYDPYYSDLREGMVRNARRVLAAAEQNNLFQIRQAVADYMGSEGCSCCCDIDKHDAHKERLALLLGVPQYSDASGYNFYRFRSGVNPDDDIDD